VRPLGAIWSTAQGGDQIFFSRSVSGTREPRHHRIAPTVGEDEVTHGATRLRVGGLEVRGWERGRPWHWAVAGAMDAAEPPARRQICGGVELVNCLIGAARSW
jgi:hypothetical protein